MFGLVNHIPEDLIKEVSSAMSVNTDHDLRRKQELTDPFVRSFVGRRFLYLHCSKEALSPGPQGPTPAAEPKDSHGWIP